MFATVNRLDDGTLEITIALPWDAIAAEYHTVVEEMAKETELPGFRKGKAPKDLVEQNLNANKVYEEVIKHLIPKAYGQAVQDLKLSPFISPAIELKDAKEGKEWVVLCRTCEKPVVTLGDYKKAVREVKDAKANKIWIPGTQPEDKEKEEKEKKPTLDELLTALFGAVTITLPKPLVDHEVNRLLSELVDQTQKLGLTVDQYLGSTQRTPESIRKEYEEQAKKTLTLEFALEKIAEEEHITVTDEELATIINTAKSEDEKKALERERYYLASIVRRQKTIDAVAAL